jgi:hypothetical protein
MKKKRKHRRWHHGADEDPGAGLLNLFDVWIAFAVALLLAIVSYGNLAKKQDASLANSQGDPGMETVPDQGATLEHYRSSDESLGGEGQRLGTAYRLKSGEVIYVPDKGKPESQRQ